jgi:flagellin
MNEEMKQLVTEINRVAKTTKFNGTTLLASQKNLSLWVGWETDAANGVSFRVTRAMSVGSLGVSIGSVQITTQSKGLVAISAIDDALSIINTQRAQWGALQNRLEYTISNLQNVNENIKASRSQIQDADFARESANLARTQVLQQAGMAMLSQANQNSQQVLSLLR